LTLVSSFIFTSAVRRAVLLGLHDARCPLNCGRPRAPPPMAHRRSPRTRPAAFGDLRG